MRSSKYYVASSKVFIRIFSAIFSILLTPYYLSRPAFAAVDLSEQYAFGDLGSLGEGINRLVGPAFAIATTAVTIYFIYAAFTYITSGGDKEAIGNARKMVTHSIIGFVMLMLLFLVVNFVFFRLFGSSIQLFEGF